MRCRLVAALSVAALFGCAPPPQPELPFRIAPTGPGIETASGGRLLELLDENEAVVQRVRFASLSARFYEADAVRTGRIRASEHGWSLFDREGEELCRGRDTDGGFEWLCGDLGFVGSLDRGAVTVLREGRTLGVVSKTETGASAEPLGGRVVHCAADGSIDGSSRATHARSSLSPGATCSLLVEWLSDSDSERPDLVQGGVAWMIWRTLERPRPAGEGSGQAVAEDEDPLLNAQVEDPGDEP